MGVWNAEGRGGEASSRVARSLYTIVDGEYGGG